MAKFGISILFQYFMHILANFSTFSRSWKPISPFNTFNTAWEPCIFFSDTNHTTISLAIATGHV